MVQTLYNTVTTNMQLLLTHPVWVQHPGGALQKEPCLMGTCINRQLHPLPTNGCAQRSPHALRHKGVKFQSLYCYCGNAQHAGVT
jgi:hypothetical protein